jgi:L-rhamnose-H+ transport protein
MHQTAVGLALLMLAGAMNGSFTLPMKFTRDWAWENTWLVWTIFALGIFPPLLCHATIPGIRDVYARTGWGQVIIVAGCGFGWGVSQVFFGLANEALGIALAFSLILGIAAVVGALEPLLVYHPEKVLTAGGLGVIGGIVLVLTGVGICAVAGRRREAILAAAASARKKSLGRGVLFCVISGLGSALVNIGLTAGVPLKQVAMENGAAAIWAPNAAWLPLMLAGGVPNLVFCIYLLSKNRTGGRFGSSATFFYVLLAGVMALFWFGSTLLYGVASTKYLGNLGTVVGWPAFMSLIVITASVWGVLTGEWRGAGKTPLRIQMAGVVVLIVAVTVLTYVSSKV